MCFFFSFYYAPAIGVFKVEQGAASGENGHVKPSTLIRYLPGDTERTALLEALDNSLTTRNAFVELVLTAVSYDGTFTANVLEPSAPAALLALAAVSASAISSDAFSESTKRAKVSEESSAVAGTHAGVSPRGRSAGNRRCLLSKLRGHSTTLLPLIAAFAGIPNGRALRNTREAHRCLEVRATYDAADVEVRAARQDYVEAIVAHDQLFEMPFQELTSDVLSMTTSQREAALDASDRITAAFVVLQAAEAARRDATSDVQKLASHP